MPLRAGDRLEAMSRHHLKTTIIYMTQRDLRNRRTMHRLRMKI